jgi:hypothetical protein
MATNVGSNFAMQAALPLDTRETVADITARNAIASGVRYDGLTVYVVSTATTYQLQGGILDANWTTFGAVGATTSDTIINALIFG